MQKDIQGGAYVGGADFTNTEAAVSAVSWPAVLAGAFVATAASLSLLFLGGAFGFASVSPWRAGPSPVMFTAMSAVWLIVMQWVSSALGGYITGRMRTKWTKVHTDEVFFRDTANGFIAWAVATIATAILASSVLVSVISGGAHAVGMMAPPMMAGPAGGPPPMGGMHGGPNDYFIDSLFRTDHPAATAPAPEVNAEATHILMKGIKEDNVPEGDKNYLAQVIVARTGISLPDAQKRVDTVIDQIKSAEEKAKEAADKAHKTAATVSLFTFLSLLVGAFIACVGAAAGGRRRDLY